MLSGFVIIIGTMLIAGLSFPVYKWGYKTLFVIAALCIASVIAFADSFVNLSTALTLLTIAAAAGITFRYRFSVQFYIITASVSLAVMLSIHYYFLRFYSGRDVFTELIKQITISMSQVEDEILQANIKAATTVFTSIKDYHIEPYYFFVNSFIMTLLSYFFLRIIYTFYIIRNIIIIKGVEFFRLDERIVLPLIAFFAGFLFVKPGTSETVYTISVNGLLILATLYFIQSIGIIRHFLIRKKLPLIILPLGLGLTIMFNPLYFPVVALILAGLGLLDVWTDFRGFNRQTEDK
ncbi:MAG: DUF2232 domain-containing protein [Spirochaetes bacterium]|nr:DUF2232 domain-containing protein [Spirochaetota bacterium]MBN2772489.1 DUF2232 domain-containing protein [Spirochaetota bacterium]